MGISSKSLTVPQFSGKEDKYEFWLYKLKAVAVAKDFIDALDKDRCGLPDDPSTVDQETDTDKKKKLEQAIKNNKMAMAMITMSFDTADLFEYIENSKTDEYPEGKAHEVLSGMQKHYRPSDRIANVEAETELMKLKMNKKNDPEEFFRKIAVLKNKYKDSKSTFTEDKLIAMTIAKAPRKYSSVITATMGAKEKALTLNDLQVAMKEYFRLQNNLMHKETKHEEEDDDGKEVTLGAFNIKCYNCNKTGHRAKDCKVKTNKTSNKSKPFNQKFSKIKKKKFT